MYLIYGPFILAEKSIDFKMNKQLISLKLRKNK